MKIDVHSILSSAARTIRLESESVSGLQAFLNNDFVKAVEAVFACSGRLVVSGIGKSAIVAQKIVATLNSTGTPSLYMHAADAIHGDLGMIQKDDVVMVISKSGNSPEVKTLIPLIKNFGNTLIGIVGSLQSPLGQQSDIVLNTTVSQEACSNNLAPTSSTTAQMVMGDALAVCLMELRGFNEGDFAKFHPGGMLGKQLYLRVQDLYINNEKPIVYAKSSLKDVIFSISAGRMGMTVVVNDNNEIEGVVTDGDLRRMLEKNTLLEGITAQQIMTHNPKTINPEMLAATALEMLKQHDITQLVVAENKSYLGIVHLHDLMREGLI
jgi:arabinose-5-phosphate isomerase